MPVQAARKIATADIQTPIGAVSLTVAESRGAAGFYHTYWHAEPLPLIRQCRSSGSDVLRSFNFNGYQTHVNRCLPPGREQGGCAIR